MLIAGLILLGLAMDAGTSFNHQDDYLLLTFPVSLLFQISINRRPIRALWIRDAPPFRPDRIVIAVGVPFSRWWRRSGNLTVTDTAHAFIDAVRNATSGLP